MLFDSLKDKFDILAPLDRSVMVPAPRARTYVIANKNGQFHFSLHVAVENLQAVFDAYNCNLPEIITSIVDSGQFILIDLNTIQTENIKFYIRIESDSFEKITSRFPFAIPNTVSIANKFISGVSFLITNNSVSQYKYYWYAKGNEMFVHRFDGQGNFIEENIEYATYSLTSDQLAKFDNRLSDIDITNLRTAKTVRTTGDQSYIGLVEGDHTLTAQTGSSPSPIMSGNEFR